MVLLNGLSRSSRHWMGFDQKLASHYRVLVIDLPGSPRYRKACTWSITIEEMARHVMDELTKQGIEKAHFFGISLGGMVALACGIHFQDRCESLTIVNSSIGNSLLKDRRISWKAFMLLIKAFISRPTPDQLNETITELVVGIDCSLDHKRQITHYLNDLTVSETPKPVNVLKQLLAATRFRPARYLPHLNVATLIVYGTHDHFVPCYNSLYLAQLIPAATVRAIDKGGHELMFDKTEQLLATQLDWQHSLGQ